MLSARLTAVVATGALVAALGPAAPAQAATDKYRVKSAYWDCTTQTARISTRYGVTGVTDYGVGDTYYLKSTVKWQEFLGTGRWGGLGGPTEGESGHWRITIPRYELWVLPASRNGLIPNDQPWRAVITVKLMKERRGPDKKLYEKVYVQPDDKFQASSDVC